MSDIVLGIVAITGALLVVLAGIGMLRFPDLYSRMHAATKAPTLGLALIAVAAGLLLDAGRDKIALAIVLVFVTTPSAAHLMARAAYRAEGIDLHLDGPDDLHALVDDPDA